MTPLTMLECRSPQTAGAKWRTHTASPAGMSILQMLQSPQGAGAPAALHKSPVVAEQVAPYAPAAAECQAVQHLKAAAVHEDSSIMTLACSLAALRLLMVQALGTPEWAKRRSSNASVATAPTAHPAANSTGRSLRGPVARRLVVDQVRFTLLVVLVSAARES